MRHGLCDAADPGVLLNCISVISPGLSWTGLIMAPSLPAGCSTGLLVWVGWLPGLLGRLAGIGWDWLGWAGIGWDGLGWRGSATISITRYQDAAEGFRGTGKIAWTGAMGHTAHMVSAVGSSELQTDTSLQVEQSWCDVQQQHAPTHISC